MQPTHTVRYMEAHFYLRIVSCLLLLLSESTSEVCMYQFPGKYHHHILFNDPVIMVMFFVVLQSLFFSFPCSTVLDKKGNIFHLQKPTLFLHNINIAQVHEYFPLLFINYLYVSPHNTAFLIASLPFSKENLTWNYGANGRLLDWLFKIWALWIATVIIIIASVVVFSNCTYCQKICTHPPFGLLHPFLQTPVKNITESRSCCICKK